MQRWMMGLWIAWLGLTAWRNTAPEGTLTVQLRLEADGDSLVLNGPMYTNRLGESFKVSELSFYLSNLRLTGPAHRYAIPQDSSYFLVRAAVPASQRLNLRHLPPGTYTELEFWVGVDSLRSVSDISRRTGVLDPANADPETGSLYWHWNTGYIFFKLEGESPQAPADPTGRRSFTYHIGGFGGFDSPTLNNLRRVRLRLAEPVTVVPGKACQRTIGLNLARFFDSVHPVSIARHPTVMLSPVSGRLADNYAALFYSKNSADHP